MSDRKIAFIPITEVEAAFIAGVRWHEKRTGYDIDALFTDDDTVKEAARAYEHSLGPED